MIKRNYPPYNQESITLAIIVAVSLRTIAIQTEDVYDVNEDNAHVPLPAQNEPYHVPSSVHAEEWKVLNDHSYSLPAYPLSVMFLTLDDDTFSTIPLSKLQEEEFF